MLVLVTDDARAETLQAMPKTRHWLADGGVTFPQGFATTPSCCPSRASIPSGRYVHNHGVLRQQLGERLDQRTTLARHLKDTGYRTAMAGKFLNRWSLRRPPPHFDRWAQANGGYYDQLRQVDGDLRRVPTYSTTFIGDQALAYLEELEGDDDRPWFLYLAPFAPHDPRVPEPSYAGATFPELDGVGGTGVEVAGAPAYPWNGRRPTPRRWPSCAPATLRTLLSVDDLVDRVLRRLADTGELDDTLVFYLSDNGYSWGSTATWASSCPTPSPSRSRSWSAGRDGCPPARSTTAWSPPSTSPRPCSTRPGSHPTPATRWTAAPAGRAAAGAAAGRVLARPGQRPRHPRLGGPAHGRLAVRRELRPAGRRHLPGVLRPDTRPGHGAEPALADDDPGNDPPATLAAELAAARACVGAGCP